MGKKGKAGQGKKTEGAAAAAIAEPKTRPVIKRPAPTASSAEQVLERFKSALIIKAELSYVLDGGRVEYLNELLSPIDCEKAHTELLKLAYNFKDVEAMHVLLRANIFLSSELGVVLIFRFLAAAFYSPLDSSSTDQDELRKTALIRLKLINEIKKLAPGLNLQQLIYSRFFSVTDLRDEYAINLLLAMAEKSGEEAEFYYHRQDLFIHACQQKFPEIILFCLDSDIFPDIEQTPLVTKGGHSPLVYMKFGSRVNQEQIRQRLIEGWAAGVELNDLCAFELLALCYFFEGLDDIKQALKDYLAGKDIRNIARQVMHGDLVNILLSKDSIFLDSLSFDDYQVIVAKTLSVPLSVATFSVRLGSQSIPCLEKIIAEFDSRCIANQLRQQKIVKQYQDFFMAILDKIPVVDANTLQFILAIFIQENSVTGVTEVAKKFPEIFEELLNEKFFANRSFNRFNFKGLSLLRAALMNNSREVAIWLYAYILDNGFDISRQDLQEFSADLLDTLASGENPDGKLLSQCLQHFPAVYCSVSIFDKLLSFYLPRASGCRHVLRNVVGIAAPYLCDVFFNLYPEKGLNVGQLENLALAAEALHNQWQEQGAPAVSCDSVAAVNQSLLRSFQLQGLKQHPLIDLSGNEFRVVTNNQGERGSRDLPKNSLYFFLRILKDKEDPGKAEISELMLRRIFFLCHEKRFDQLRRELTELHEFEDDVQEAGKIVKKITRATVFALLCYFELYELAELCLVMCPNLDFSEPASLGDCLRPLSILCQQGNIRLARKVMSYIVEGLDPAKGYPILQLEPLEYKGSPAYISSQARVCVARPEDKKDIARMLPENLQVFTDAAKLQAIAHFDNMQMAGGMMKPLGRLINSLHKSMANTMLLTAIQLRDSSLILMALKRQVDLHDAIPASYRELVSWVLFLSPDEDLFDKLQMSAEEILQARDYSERGYLRPVSGLTICLTQLEIALIARNKYLAGSYCQLLCRMFKVIDISNYQLLTFIYLLHQFKSLVSSPRDLKDIMNFCYQAVVTKDGQLSRISFSQELLAFIQDSIRVSFSEHSQQVARIKSFLTAAFLRLNKENRDSDFFEKGGLVNFPRLALPRIPAYQSVVHGIWKRSSNVNFFEEANYRAAAVAVSLGSSLPKDLRVLQLCQLLIFSQFLPGIQKTIRDALKQRVSTRPDEINETEGSLSPLQLLAQDVAHQDLVGLLLEQDVFHPIVIAGERSPFVIMCDRWFAWEILEKFCRRVPADMSLEGLLRAESAPGSSSLYVFYQVTGRRDCVDFLINHAENIGTCGDKSIIELLVLVRAWLADASFNEYHERLKEIEVQILGVIQSSKINYITHFRRRNLSASQILVGLRASQEELNVYVTAYDLPMLVNAAISSLNIPLFRAVCDFMDRYGFSIDLRQIYDWMDKENVSSAVLFKLMHLLDVGRDLHEVMEILKGVLERADIKDMLIQENIKEIVIKMLRLTVEASAVSFVSIVRVANLAQETIKELARIAVGRDGGVLVAIVNYYGELYPEDFNILAENKDFFPKILPQVSLVQEPLLAKFFKMLSAKSRVELIDMLEPLDITVLSFIQKQARNFDCISQAAKEIFTYKQKSKALPFQEFLAGKEAKKQQKLAAEQARLEEEERLQQLEEKEREQERIKAERQAAELARQQKQEEQRRQVEEKRKADLLQQEQERKQRLADKEKEDELTARKQKKRAHVRDHLTKPLDDLQRAVTALRLNGCVDLSRLAEFRSDIIRYQTKLKELTDFLAIENKNRLGVNQSLNDCQGVCAEINATLSSLMRDVDQREQEIRRAEQQRLERERLEEEGRKRERQAEEARLAKERAEALAAAERQRLAEQADEEFCESHERGLTQVLKDRYTERMQRASTNPQAFRKSAVPVDAIAAVVPRAKLVQDEIGLKVVFEDSNKFIDVAGGYDLYVRGPAGIKSGQCRVYFSIVNFAVQWTILQNSQEFLNCNVQPLHAATLQLKHGDRIVLESFVPGICLPTAAPTVKSF